MQNETNQCQNCKNDFIIEPEDFVFYEKIKVPPPTFCPDCDHQRRLNYRNTHSLYKRKDSFSGKDIISIYSPDKDLVVIDQKTWWSDEWDPMDYGRDYDFNETFFDQWKDFRDKFPLQNLSNSKAVNSDYCNVAEESKDSYLCTASWMIENTYYSNAISSIKDSMDLQVVHNTDFSYDDLNCTDSSRLFYSQNSNSCVNSYFLYDCRGCTDCFMCSNLRNKSYCFNNKQLTKEEYKELISKIDFGSHKTILDLKSKFNDLKLNSIHRFAFVTNSHDVTGNNIDHAKNCHNCFDLTGGVEDCKNSFWLANRVKDVYNSGPGCGGIETGYEIVDTGAGGSNIYFGNVIYYSANIEYSFNCYNCTFCFACLGLRKKNYCIFNKQYTKEEYLQLRGKIINHMNEHPYINQNGIVYKYGEFFPSEMSTFCYNETVANDNFPLTKEEALKNGYNWKDKEERNYVPTIRSNDIPDNIKDVGEDILNEVIECEHRGECNDRCSTAFKIIKDELIFYKRFNIPIPHLCYGCRYSIRFRNRNPLKLWNRSCMKEGCNNEFETSYAPDRPEIVYCEKCYQSEVY